MRRRTSWVVITCAALVALTPGAAWASHRRGTPRDMASGERLYGCEQGGRSRDETGLVKSTEPAPGAVVTPGQEIRVELTWATGDFVDAHLHKVLECVTVDGRLSAALSGGEKPSANDGRFTHSYVVPADAAPGTLLCDQGFATGPAEDDEYARKASGEVCFTVERPRALPSVEEPPSFPADSGGQRADAGTPVSFPASAVELPHTGGSKSHAGQAAACLALAALARRRGRRLR